MTTHPLDVIVIGAGVAGLTAARLASQRGLRVACAEQLMFGGLIVNINELDPVPPGHGLSGADFASELMMQVADLNVANISEEVIGLERDGEGFSAITREGRHSARIIIVATGARLRRMGIPGESAFEHRGVSSCADCDGPLFADRDVIVVGGGDSALQEAHVLSNFCRRVHLVHRGECFTARQSLIDSVRARANIEYHMNSAVVEIRGTDEVHGVVLRKLEENRIEEIACSGVFAYIGLEPNAGFLPPEVRRDGRGQVVTDAQLQTTQRGIYAIGAVRAGYGGLLTDAISDALLAVSALSAGREFRRD